MNRIALIITLALFASYSTLSARERPESSPSLPADLFAQPIPQTLESGLESAEAERSAPFETQFDIEPDPEPKPEPEPTADEPAQADPEPSVPRWFEAVNEGAWMLDEDLGLVKGRRSYSEERAFEDARDQLRQAILDWLGPKVSADWELPASLLDSMIISQHVESIPVDLENLGLDPGLGAPENLFVVSYQVDFSPSREAEITELYQRDLSAYRLKLLGGGLGFVLACLTILSIYIRADEATKGYYTNKLRLLAVTTAGASGLAIYQFLT